MKRVEYSLFWMNGEGHQPYATVQAAGAVLDGGHFVANGRYCGTLTGSAEACAAALVAMAVFAARELSIEEWEARLSASLPPNL